MQLSSFYITAPLTILTIMLMIALCSFNGTICQISYHMGHLQSILPTKFPAIQYTVYVIFIRNLFTYIICGHSGVGAWTLVQQLSK